MVIRDSHRPPGLEGKLRRPYVWPWVVTAVNPGLTLQLADLDGHALPRAIPFNHVRLWHASASQPDSDLLGWGM